MTDSCYLVRLKASGSIIKRIWGSLLDINNLFFKRILRAEVPNITSFEVTVSTHNHC